MDMVREVVVKGIPNPTTKEVPTPKFNDVCGPMMEEEEGPTVDETNAPTVEEIGIPREDVVVTCWLMKGVVEIVEVVRVDVVVTMVSFFHFCNGKGDWIRSFKTAYDKR